MVSQFLFLTVIAPLEILWIPLLLAAGCLWRGGPVRFSSSGRGRAFFLDIPSYRTH
jgi:hypothetical protein